MSNPELKEAMEKLEATQVVLKKLMDVTPHHPLAFEVQRGRMALAYYEVSEALSIIDDVENLS